MTEISPAVQLTRQLIAVDTRNPGGSETAGIRILEDILKDAGFTVETVVLADGRPSLIARRGAGRRPALCFAGHIDTVPLGEAPWRFDPFGGTIDNGLIYGRGASDMKSGLAAMVTAACRLAPRMDREDDLVLLVVAGEETGCEGSRYLARQPNRLGRVGALIVTEPSNNYPLVGHKGALWLSARFSGRTAHGAMPEKGDNAVYKAVAAVERLRRFDFPAPIHPMLGKASLNIGFFHGGININSVPAAAEIGIDLRTVPGIDHGALADWVRTRLGADAALTPMVDVAPLWTDPDHPWIKDVYSLMTPLLGEHPVPRTVAFFTDGAPLQAAYGGIPTLVLGPGNSVQAHQTDEFCAVAAIDRAVDIYETIAAHWYGLPPRHSGP